jgi:hypothetical protein
MIVTGFLGFFSIAQNDFNSTTTTTTNYDKPFPKFGEVSERPSSDNVAALAQWNKEVAIQKA